MILGSIIFDSTLTQLTFNKHVVSAKISNTGKVSVSVWTSPYFQGLSGCKITKKALKG